MGWKMSFTDLNFGATILNILRSVSTLIAYRPQLHSRQGQGFFFSSAASGTSQSHTASDVFNDYILTETGQQTDTELYD